MLICLRIRNFAIIDSLEVEFGAGLNVVTGETGAGKSILVDALELVLGARAKPEVVRTGAAEAEVEALFDISKSPELRARLEASGIEWSEDASELIVRRIVTAQGRTRAYVNGKMVTAGQLQEIAGGLVDISSQHEHHRLVDPSTHLGYLDAFARLDAMRDQMSIAHESLAKAESALRSMSDAMKNRAEREDLLRFQIKEINDLAPQIGEEDSNNEERGRLRYAERLSTIASRVEEALYARDGAIAEELGRNIAELGDIAKIDSRLEPLTRELESARSQIEDVARELSRYTRGITVDPERLTELDDRVDRLNRMKRKYGGSIEGIIEHRNRAQEELDSIEQHEERTAILEKTKAVALADAAKLARTLSEKRKKAAAQLGRAISNELASLGMGDAKVEIEIAPISSGDLEVDGAKLSSTGIDRAEFLISPNRGEEARPLRKVASGGELSRAMLAIKRVLAGLGPHGLYVFDEVDSGVGGGVAEVIGKKLRDVAEHHQVICVTHLAQIAVHGEVQYRVRKEIVANRTRSTIEALDPKERLEEIARMLGGLKITAKTRAAAAEMLREAHD